MLRTHKTRTLTSSKKVKHKVKPINYDWTEVHVTKKGSTEFQMTTRTVTVRNSDMANDKNHKGN